ncbi:1,4-benzoquinone reductase-like [Phaffia rhodozyma]|uniref:1,4-benzoquinone reductase-like n=1 Tax=Phaffia rhodozyma TaxID=264483 RepID=A0A0F7SP56_PHARH|nr:1,4-benzoquinone reductase-like [Phaffia rhodozyma]
MVAKIAVIIYSTWGHINTLSESVVAGLKESGAEVTLFQIQETLSEEIRAKMHAAPKLDIPVITPKDLPQFDGFLFGFGTRYGRAPASVSAFFDATGGLWASGALVGKFAGVFFGAGSNHGGHETTALTTVPFFAHQGMIYVPIGFVRPELSIVEKVVGGSAYGASYIAGSKGQLPVTEEDKAVGRYQGQSFGTLVNTFVKGRNL